MSFLLSRGISLDHTIPSVRSHLGQWSTGAERRAGGRLGGASGVSDERHDSESLTLPGYKWIPMSTNMQPVRLTGSYCS